MASQVGFDVCEDGSQVAVEFAVFGSVLECFRNLIEERLECCVVKFILPPKGFELNSCGLRDERHSFSISRDRNRSFGVVRTKEGIFWRDALEWLSIPPAAESWLRNGRLR